MTLIVLAFFKRTDALVILRFRFHFMLVQEKWPRAIGIFQPRAAAPAPRVGHGFYGRDTHHQELILAGAFELNCRDAGAFNSGAHDHDAVPTEKNRIVCSQRIYHASGECETIDPMTVGKNRHAVGKDPRLSVERNQSAIE